MNLLLKNAIQEIEQHARWEFDSVTAESLRCIVREIETAAVKVGLPTVVSICQIKAAYISVQTARLLVAECVAALPNDWAEPVLEQKPTGGALSREHAAAYLSISTRKLDQLLARGVLRRLKVGRKTLVTISDLDNYLNNLGTKSHS